MTNKFNTNCLRSSDEKLITIGIPTRNRVQSLKNLLRTIRTQTYQNFKILISDDGDKFDLEKELSAEFSDLPITILNGLKRSLPVNRQHIVNHSATEYVLMCDDDHIMDPNCIKELVSVADENVDAGIVSAIWPDHGQPVYEVDIERLQNHPDFCADLKTIDSKSNFWWKRGCYYFRTVHLPNYVTETEMAGGGCLLYRKSVVQLVGGFPRDYSLVSFREDTDFSSRVSLHGFRILVNSRAIAYHARETDGGSRDTQKWASDFVHDGLKFLKKLTWFRERARQVNEIKTKSKIKVLVFYDEVGWAWWHRAHNLKKLVSADIEIDIQQIRTLVNADDFDFVLLFDAYLIDHVQPFPAEKLIVANSCPKLISETQEVIDRGLAHAAIINNRATYLKYEEDRRYFCCQNGVDLELFYPSKEVPSVFRACWVGNSKSIGNKGLDLIEDACARLNIELIKFDASTLSHVSQALTQAQLRDNVYHNAAVVICASEFEGTPNPALEGLACGLGVISTNVGNIPEVISNGYNGFVVERSVEAIMDALVKMKSMPAEQLRNRSRQTIEQGWGWNDQVRKYEECIRELFRLKAYGEAPSFSIDKDLVESVVQSEMSAYIDIGNFRDTWVQEDHEVYRLDSRILKNADGKNPNIERISKFFAGIEDFYLHFGDLSDYLMLVASLKGQSDVTILSVTNDYKRISEVSKKLSFIKKLYVLDLDQASLESQVLRLVLQQSDKCLGSGVAIKTSYDEDWSVSKDIKTEYGVTSVRGVFSSLIPMRVTDPQVSIFLPEKPSFHFQNQCSTLTKSLFEEIVFGLNQLGITPFIVGGYDVSVDLTSEVRDLRSLSFESQLGMINSSDVVLTAEYWVSVFRGMNDGLVGTFPKHSLDEKQALRLCPTTHAYCSSWESNSMVSDYREVFSRFFNGGHGASVVEMSGAHGY